MTQNDILDKIEKNEKKSKVQLLVLVSTCLLLGFLTIMYSRESNKKTIALENKTIELTDKNEELEREKAEKDGLYNRIKQDSAKLADLSERLKKDSVNLALTRNNALKNNEVLIAKNEVLIKNTVEFKDYIQKAVLVPDPIIYSIPPPTEGNTNSEKYRRKHQIEKYKDLEVELKNYEVKIQDYQTKAVDNKNLYLIYLQESGQNGKNIAINIRKSLVANGYNAPGIEHIQKDFDSRISYFYEDDKETAENIYKEIAKIIARTNPSFNLKQLVPQKSNIKANRKQIEVWINI